MLGLLRQVHAWAGVGLCLILAMLGLSGTLLVFKDDWLRMVFAPALTGAHQPALSLGAQLEAIEAAHAADGLRHVVLASEGFALHRLGFADGGGAYVDAQGVVIDRWSAGGRPEEWLFELHHRLLAGETGEMIAGIAGLAAAVMVLTGVMIWWPAARSFGARVWPRSGRRRDLLAHHRDLGVMMALPILVLAVTGASMVFSDQARAVLGWATASGSPDPAGTPPTPIGPGDTSWPAVIAAAQDRFADATPRIAIWPAAPDRPAVLRLRQPAEWHPNGRTSLSIDPASGRIVASVDALALGAGDRMFNALYPVHAAKVGDRIIDGLWAAAGLGMTSLALLGAWAFVRKPRRRVARVPIAQP
jgi:uncharacterized iron-regulated membrane protein